MIEERYIRNLGALTEQECAMLRTKAVFVAGCGGLGGYLIEMLLRLGVGIIRAADGDVFEASNLNRQLLSSVQSLGEPKVEAAARRAAAVNPNVRFEAVPEFVTVENAAELVRDCDAVLDALDNIPSRRILARACAEARIPLIHGAIRGWCAQAAVVMPGNDLIDSIYPENAVLNGDVQMRTIMPNAKVITIDDIQFASNAAVGYNVTAAAYPYSDWSGDTHRELYLASDESE